MIWNIWLVSAYTGDKKELIASYENRGHAIAKLRGLDRAAWESGKNHCYSIDKG